MSKADAEWELMYAEYIKRVPAPVFKADPPPRTALEEQLKVEDKTLDDEEHDEV